MASEYHRGDMDIHEQASTYHAFNIGSKWGSLAIAVLVLFLTLFFCTDANFLTAAISSLVVLVLGIVLLREKKGDGH
jgi:hypothetical protein